MVVTLDQIKKLREQTGAGIGNCKKALEESKGDFDKAIEYLRKEGIAKAAKRADKAAAEGVVGVYLHANKKICALVELNCETDFAARSDEFCEIAHDFAMQVAAMDPEYLDRGSVPAEVLEKEKDIYREELNKSGKPDSLVEKILEGKLNKFFAENCLMEQTFIKDDSKNMSDYLNEAIAKIGERLEIGKFTRFTVGN